MRPISKETALRMVESFRIGIPPTEGLEHIVVGRRQEVEADKEALLSVENGGSIVKFVIGAFGTGKTFELSRNKYLAHRRNMVTMHTDFSVHKRLYAHDGSALALWKHLAESLDPSLETIFSAFMEKVKAETREGEDVLAVTEKMLRNITGVNSVYFRQIIYKYCLGITTGNQALRDAAVRWICGGYRRRDDARRDLGKEIEDIPTDENWLDMLKCMTQFVVLAGYRALGVYLDEAINLYKIDATPLRNKNYELLLTIINEQTPHLLIMIAGTPEFLEDRRRGLYSYGALATRLSVNQFADKDVDDNYQPVVILKPLRKEDIAMLIFALKRIYESAYGRAFAFTELNVEDMINDFLRRPGADNLLSPRAVIRRFADMANLMIDNPDLSFDDIRARVPVKSAAKRTNETNIKEI